MTVHPGMRFSVDPWDPSYGVSLDAAEGQSRQEVDAGVELSAEQWSPVDPPAGVVAPAATLFVDGVRRVDAQVWVDDGAQALPAMCASYAAGVICCCAEGGAHLAASEVRRGIVTTAERAVDVVTGAGRYTVDVIAAKPNQPPAQALSQRVQGLLNEVEVAAAGQARERLGCDDDLLVVDGPLRGRDRLARAVGYIKTHHMAYLDPDQNAVVAMLGPGQRTPIFRLTSTGGWSRYTWYLRLPCPPGAPWAGIVRLECSAELAVAAAAALAGRTPGDAGPLRLGRVQGLPRPAEPVPDRRPGAGAAPPARGCGSAVPSAACGGGPPGGRGGGPPGGRRRRAARWTRRGAARLTCRGARMHRERRRVRREHRTPRSLHRRPGLGRADPQRARRWRRPLARLTGRPTAARTAASDPTTRTNVRARVTAV